ncbi:MAG: SemiSWEET family transporter [Burkholderiales bacterium]
MNAVDTLGTVGSTLASFMFIALWEVAVKNYRGVTRIWIQPLLTLTNCVIWTWYASLIQDYYVMIPNAFGIALALITLGAIRFGRRV